MQLKKSHGEHIKEKAKITKSNQFRNPNEKNKQIYDCMVIMDPRIYQRWDLVPLKSKHLQLNGATRCQIQ